MYEIESKSVYDDFSKNIGMLDFGNYSSKSKYFDDLDALFLGKTKDETDSLATEELARLKPKVDSILVNDSSEYKKRKSVNENVVAKISNDEPENVLFNKKWTLDE